VARERATFFEHCARALDRSLRVGSHGLPLMGTGDWNDGMNRVGHKGAGESVWLGWFLYGTLREFARLAELRGQHQRADAWQRHVDALQAALWAVLAFAAIGEGDKAGELFAILNPINHTNTRAGVHRYKVEPYVAAADVYAEPPHVGRGGWTWYTGSAGWMHRAGIEWI